MAFDESTSKLEPGQFDPSTAHLEAPPPERGMVAKLGSAALSGAGAAATKYGSELGLAASTPFMLADKIAGAVTGKPQTSAQDFAFKNLVDPMERYKEKFTPTPEEASSIPLSVAHGLGSMAVDLPGIAMTHGKIGVPEAVATGARVATMAEKALSGMISMAPAAVANFVDRTSTAMSQGVDNPHAYASGALSGVSTTLMGALPMSLQGGVIKRVLSGAASSAATGELERQGQNKVLEDYPNLHQALTAQSVATNMAMGGLLGGIMGPRPEKTQIAKEIAETEKQLQIGYTPTEQRDTLTAFPDGTVGRGADVEAYLKTLPVEERLAARDKLMNRTGRPEATAGEPIPAWAEEAGLKGAMRDAPTGEPAPVIETIPAKSQQHAADMAILRDASEVPTGDPVADAARAFALHNDPVVMQQAATEKAARAQLPPDLDSGHQPTAMELAMLDAQRARGIADTQAGTEAGFAAAEQAAAAQKATELTAIQNVAKGSDLAAAAARGEVPAEAVDLRAPKDDFVARLQEVLPEEMGKSTKTTMENELKRLVDGKETYDEQLAAIKERVDALSKTKPQRYEFFKSLYDKLTNEREQANEVPSPEATPTEAIKTEAQGPEKAVVNPAADAFTALARAYQDENAAIRAMSRINDEANAAARGGIAPVSDVVARMHAEAEQVTAARQTPGTMANARAIKRQHDALTRAAEGMAKADLAEANHEAARFDKLAEEGHMTPEEMAANQRALRAVPKGDLNAFSDVVGAAADKAEARRDTGERLQKVPAANDTAPERSPREQVLEKVNAAQDSLDATVAGFTDRLRAGEQLTPDEQARFEDASQMRKSLADAIDPRNRPSSDSHLESLASFAADSATPEAWKASEGNRIGLKAGPQDKVPGAWNLLRTTNQADAMYAHIAENGSTPEFRALAQKLRDIGTKTTMSSEPDLPQGVAYGSVAAYDTDTNHIYLTAGRESEHAILHEGVHAATVDAIDQAALITKPRNQAEATKMQAYRDLEKIREAALMRVGADDHYGLTNAREFMAELNTNPEFQKFLNTKSLWTKVVDGVRRLLGLDVTSKTSLEKAMGLQDTLFGREQYEAAQQVKRDAQEFNASPEGAAKVTDSTLSLIAKRADEEDAHPSIWARANQYIDQKLLGTKTTQYIADRVRARPELAAFSKFLDRYEGAYKARELAGVYVGEPAGKFTERVDSYYRTLPADKARELNQSLQRIGAGSSIGGFDPALDYSANLKLRPDMAASKQVVETLHREFSQLPAEAQKAIIEGAQLHRREYVFNASTLVSNLMNSVTGNAIRLEAELAHMPATDAAYARMQARVLSARSEANLAVTHAPGLDYMGKDLQTARNGNPTHHLDGASYTLDQRLMSAFAAAEKLPEGSVLREQLHDIQGKYVNQIKNPYFHAGRSGDFFVTVGWKNMNDATWAKMEAVLKGTGLLLGDHQGQDHAFFKVDTADQAAGLRRKLEAAGLGVLDTTKSAAGRLADNLDNSNAGVSSALRSVLSSLHDSVEIAGLSPEQAGAMRDAMTRQVLSMLPESSSRLATIKRMGVPGYGGDFLGSFAKRALGSSRDTANVYSLRAYGEAFKGMRDEVAMLAHGGDIKSQEYAEHVRNEISTRYNDSMKPLDNSVVNTINSVGHTAYLAFAPAFYIRTSAQPWHRGMPYLGSKFGFVAAAKEMAGTNFAVAKIMAATIKKGWQEAGVHGVLDADMNFKGLNLSAPEEAFVQELHDRGVLNLGQARQLQNMVMSGSPKMQDATRMAAMTATYAEMSNRLVTGLAAFRLAQKKGGDASANTEYAVKAIDYVMDNFDPNNTARLIGKHGFAGKVTPLTTAFMNYNLQTMQQIARTVHDGLFSGEAIKQLAQDTSEAGVKRHDAAVLRSYEAKKEFAGLMATTTVIAGTMGLPFANVFAGVYNWLIKDDDNPSDIREGYRNFLSDTLGVKAGEIAAHGLGTLAGVDTSSFGMQDLLPGTQFLASRRLMKDRLAETAQGLLGPALNFGMDMGLAISKFSDGEYIKGMEHALPSALKGPWKAGELATRGYTDASGNPIGLTATPWDITVQAFGFRPAARAETAEASNYSQTDTALRNHRKSVITNQIFKAYKFGDDSDKAEAQAALLAYNKKNPRDAITDIAAVFRQHIMGEALGRASGTGVTQNLHQYVLNQNNLRFANQGGMGMQ